MGDLTNAGPSRAEPSLPRHKLAGNPELMREVFQEHLRPLGEEAYLIRECQVSRSKARRHGEGYMLLLYTLRLEESGTGRERVQWVTGVMHAKGGRIRREWEKLQRSEPERVIPGASSAAFEPYAFIPELEMLVQIFPHDYRLPSLPLLMAGPLPELEPLLLGRFGKGEWQTEAWNVEPAWYLPGKRITLRLTMQARDNVTGEAEERRFYAKVYHEEEKGKRTYRVLRELDGIEAGAKVSPWGGP